MRPGTARPVTQYVTVRGATSYPPEESIAYMTVNIGQISLLEAAVGWLDDDVDIRPEEVIRGGRSVEENRRYNAQLLDASKQVASTVALRHHGYEVTIRTSGTNLRPNVEEEPAAPRSHPQ